jgi:hypothetical protein
MAKRPIRYRIVDATNDAGKAKLPIACRHFLRQHRKINRGVQNKASPRCFPVNDRCSPNIDGTHAFTIAVKTIHRPLRRGREVNLIISPLPNAAQKGFAACFPPQAVRSHRLFINRNGKPLWCSSDVETKLQNATSQSNVDMNAADNAARRARMGREGQRLGKVLHAFSDWPLQPSLASNAGISIRAFPC